MGKSVNEKLEKILNQPKTIEESRIIDYADLISGKKRHWLVLSLLKDEAKLKGNFSFEDLKKILYNTAKEICIKRFYSLDENFELEYSQDEKAIYLSLIVKEKKLSREKFFPTVDPFTKLWKNT